MWVVPKDDAKVAIILLTANNFTKKMLQNVSLEHFLYAFWLISSI